MDNEHTFTLDEIAKAAGVPYTRMNNWIAKKAIHGLDHEALGEVLRGRGVRREFPLQIAAMLILAAAIQRHGVPIEAASRVAFDWALIGSYDDGKEGVWVSAPAKESAAPSGLPECTVYPTGMTILSFLPNPKKTSDNLDWKITNVPDDMKAEDFWAQTIPGHWALDFGSYSIVRIDTLMQNGFRALGVDPALLKRNFADG